MQERIVKKLREMEKENHIQILLAVESGSRAWGFASPDSDYDVRFIYVRNEAAYLRLDRLRDVIELPIVDELDINGWDLQKTLRLLYDANPTLFEWFSSPIVYMETPFANRFRSIMMAYFSQKKSLYHYISMAEGNYRGYLKGEMVRAKKYFYVLRPVLACRWVLRRNTPPPMNFSALAEAELPTALTREVRELLRLKMDSPELREIPRMDPIHDFLEGQLAELKEKLSAASDQRKRDWQELNALFLSAIPARK